MEQRSRWLTELLATITFCPGVSRDASTWLMKRHAFCLFTLRYLKFHLDRYIFRKNAILFSVLVVIQNDVFT
jgi:hypothetical protein